jgi:hypothetical protein
MHRFVFFLALLPILTLAETTKLIIELFRHGIRESASSTFDNQGIYEGQLTATGMRQHYLLGGALALRYPHLAQPFDPAHIYVRSTDINRTIMSA